MLSKFCAAIPIVADDDFEEALQGTWSSNPVITVATLDTEISDLTATGAAFVAGMLTLLSGFPTLNTSSNVGRIGYNGSTITGPNFVLNASFNINNNLRAQKVVGNIGAVGIGNGEFTATGQLQTYFGDASVYNQILNNTLTSFDMRLGRADGNARRCCSTSRRSSCRGARRRCQQEPGRDDPGRLPGLYARHPRLYHERQSLPVRANIIGVSDVPGVSRGDSTMPFD